LSISPAWWRLQLTHPVPWRWHTGSEYTLLSEVPVKQVLMTRHKFTGICSFVCRLFNLLAVSLISAVIVSSLLSYFHWVFCIHWIINVSYILQITVTEIENQIIFSRDLLSISHMLWMPWYTQWVDLNRQ
jgi:hypothetical protein